MNSGNFNDDTLEVLNKIGTLSGLLDELREQNSILTDENLEPEVFHRFASKKKIFLPHSYLKTQTLQ